MLRIENIDVFYGDAQALWGINLRVLPGEICALIGANGGGKTTLLKSICGLLPAAKGSIFLEGASMQRVGPEERVSLGLSMCPEGRKIFPSMTVEENLKVGSYVKRVWRKRDQLLEQNYDLFSRLKERRNQMAGTMSGGERQMLAIARSLMSEPKLLFLDEPSLGLAPNMVDKVMEAIQTINQKGVTILLVEQNVNFSLTISKRGYVIESGHIVMEDESKKLLADDHVKQAYLGI